MADDAPTAQEVQTLISVTRKRALAFGLALGKKPEGTVLFMHRKKSPEMLLKVARKTGETRKIAYGEVSTEGSKIAFKCLEKPKGAMAKQLKQYFRSINLKLAVVMLGPDGEALETDQDDQDDQETGEAAETAPADDPLQGDWERRKAALTPMILAALKAGKVDVGKVRAAWAFAQEHAGQGDFAVAIKVGERLEKLIAAANRDSGAAQPQTKAPARKALAQSRLLWTKSVEKMRSEADRLKVEIINVESMDEDNDPEDVQEMQSKIATIQTFMDPFDGRLESALTDAVDAPDLDKQQAALANCRSILKDFSARLQHPFFAMVDSENGYAEVAIASTAKTSIARIQEILG